MNVKKCAGCDKELPASHVGTLCSLCAIGLRPSGAPDLKAHHQTGFEVQGRMLSGLYCTHCHAELNLADLSRRSCSICGAHVDPEILRAMAHRSPVSAGPTGVRWPDDAPSD
jgi:hypothetical protein